MEYNKGINIKWTLWSILQFYYFIPRSKFHLLFVEYNGMTDNRDLHWSKRL